MFSFVAAGQALQTGEGGHPGDDREAPGDDAAPADRNVSRHGSAGAQQVPRWVQ